MYTTVKYLIYFECSVEDNIKREVFLKFGMIHFELPFLSQILIVSQIGRVDFAIEWEIKFLTL